MSKKEHTFSINPGFELPANSLIGTCINPNPVAFEC
jgi:hypothetical protein